jgi:hypothetical protein
MLLFTFQKEGTGTTFHHLNQTLGLTNKRLLKIIVSIQKCYHWIKIPSDKSVSREDNWMRMHTVEKMSMHTYLPHLTVLLHRYQHIQRNKKAAKDSWQDGPFCSLKQHTYIISHRFTTIFLAQVNIKTGIIVLLPQVAHIERSMMFIRRETRMANLQFAADIFF